MNFGNPHNPENFWQLVECVEGLAEGCRAFNTPVTGGNVSLYNQSPAGAIDPTPTVGMVGLIENERHITTSHFKNAGDAVILLGNLVDANADAGLGGSHFLKVLHGKKAGCVPTIDFPKELALHDAMRALIKAGLVQSAHDCSEGGLAVTLAESCLSNREEAIGASITLPAGRADALLFGEAQSRIVITTTAVNASAALSLLQAQGIPAQELGTVGGRELKIAIGTNPLAWPLGELHHSWYGSIARTMEA